MAISSINDATAMAAGAIQNASDHQTKKLENDLKGGYENANAEELYDACKSFESYFMEQILKEVDKSTPMFGSITQGDSYASKMTDFYKDQMIQTMAGQMTEKTGNTLANQLYEQMKRNYGITDEKDQAKAEALAQAKARAEGKETTGTEEKATEIGEEDVS